MKIKRIVLGIGLVAAGSLVGAASGVLPGFQDSVARVSKLLSKRAEVRSMATFPSEVVVTNFAGVEVAGMGEDEIGDGLMGVANHTGSIRVGAVVSVADAGQVFVTDQAGVAKYAMDGLGGFVTFTGDIAEAFPADRSAVPAGSVLVIDPLKPGAVRVSDTAYDRRVAGVAAGANGYRPGMTLRALADIENKVPVTLTGTVYCLATNANGRVRAGDLLTTSSVPGHAMRVTDQEAARGAILGKAMEDLTGERGLVLVLASLQ
jgi:hypothetical protein